MNSALKNFVLISVFSTFVISPAAFVAQETTQSALNHQKIEIRGDIEAATQAWPLIEAGALVIDVRSEEEFAGGHLDGAINIVHTETDALTAAIGAQTDRQVVLYCRSGNRAGRALDKLEALGYTAVFNASGLDALQATKP